MNDEENFYSECYFHVPEREVWDRFPQFFRAGEDPEDLVSAENDIDDILYFDV